MPVNQGFGAHGEFGHGEHSDDLTGFALVGVTDSYPLLASESYAVLASLLRSDTALPMLAVETAGLAVTLVRTEMLTVTTSEVAALFAALTTRSDDVLVSIGDAGALMAAFTTQDDGLIDPSIDDIQTIVALLVRPDSLSVLVSEAGSLFTTVARSDTVSTLVSEIGGMFADLTARSDDYQIVLTDSGIQLVAVNTGDDAPVMLTEEVIYPFIIRLSRSDVLNVLTERMASGSDFGALGEFAHGEHARDFNAPAIVRELVEIYATLSRIDTLSPRADDATIAATILSRLDTLLPMIVESDARAEQRLSRRIINVIQY